MFNLFKLMVKRAGVSGFLILILYSLVFLQYLLFTYFSFIGILSTSIIKAGYLIGLFGFIAGIFGIQFLLIQQKKYEMGNLETMGYSRIIYIQSYLLQNIFYFIISAIIASLIFYILYNLAQLKTIAFIILLKMNFQIFLQLAFILIVPFYFFLLFVSHSDPLLLLKEKK